MYLCPVVREGVSFLRWLMTSDIEKDIARLIDNAINSGKMIKNEEGISSIFPLVGKDGVQYYIGVEMDVRQLAHAIAVAEYKTGRYGVICQKWQAKYYRKLIPTNFAICTVSNK